MSQQIVPFEFEGQGIRVIRSQDGEPWFVAKDVAIALGYVNHNDAVSKHCKGVAKRYPLETGGGLQEVRIISQADVLRLIVNSKLPKAQEFERWVFEDVLPTILKTGTYITPNAAFTANIAKLDLLRESNGFLKELVVAQRTYLQLYRGMRLKGPQLILAVQNAFLTNFGIDLAQVAPLPDTPNSDGSYAAVIEDRLVTPTYLGKTLELRNPGKSTNDLLEQAGLMVRDVNREPTPTETGKPLGDWIETGKKHHSGAPIMAWRWKECATLEKLRAVV